MACIIIPARWKSSRFPGKPLTLIGGVPLILRVWEACCGSRLARRVIVATDDMRIAETAFAAGAEIAVTKPSHPSGTDRVAEVASRLPSESIVINVQGDEPFTDPRLVDKLIATLRDNPRLSMATAASPIETKEDFLDPNVVKVVLAGDGRALYFSRAPIPCDRDGASITATLRHHGIYGYRRKFLLEFVKWKPSPLEKLEKLEQLRALEHGASIAVLRTHSAPPGIDTPDQAVAANAFLTSGKSR